MKERTAFNLLVILYFSTVVLNQFWTLFKDSGDIYLSAIGEQYPLEWYVYFITKSITISFFIFGLYLATWIRERKRFVRLLAFYFIGWTLIGTVLFAIYQYKKPVELEILYGALFALLPIYNYFNRRYRNPQEGEGEDR